MSFMPNKVKVIPCSGIGKVHGLLTREIALEIITGLCPNESETECLAYIVTGNPEIKGRIKGKVCLTLDGCPKMCASTSVTHAGGTIAEEFRLMDALKEYRGVKPGTPTALNDEGWQIVDETAQKLAARVRELYGEESIWNR